MTVMPNDGRTAALAHVFGLLLRLAEERGLMNAAADRPPGDEENEGKDDAAAKKITVLDPSAGIG